MTIYKAPLDDQRFALFDLLGAEAILTRLQGGAELRRRFDWYLSLDGEFTLEAIRTLLLADVRDAHGDELAAQVGEWFERYLGLRAELAGLALSSDPRQRLRQLSDAQRRWFGAEAEAWFGEELAQLIPGAEFHFMPDMGHGSWYGHAHHLLNPYLEEIARRYL